jgi:hypothetical protein
MTLTLVLGASGKTGRRVIGRLDHRGVPTRAGSPRFDLDDRTTWAPALDRAGALFIRYFPDLEALGREPRDFAEYAEGLR